MTRYMKETLNCDVFIIEIDEASYINAIQYAYDGYCGDIEKFEWKNKLAMAPQFDFVIFSDVIEHLVNPEPVVKEVLEYLKFDGKVLFSVPNIAHNAVIIDLIRNKFIYRTTGLLDYTHLRHFTYDSLCELVGKCGLVPYIQDGTVIQLSESEFNNDYRDVPPAVEMELAKKEFGTVYQFIFICVKHDYYKYNSDSITIQRKIKDIPHTEQLKLYAEVNGQFTEHRTVETQYTFGYNTLEFDVRDYGVKRFRVDFANRPCMVIIETIKINGTAINTALLNGNYNSKIENAMLFSHSDPYVFISSDEVISTIEVELTIKPVMDEQIFKLAENAILQKQLELAAVPKVLLALTNSTAWKMMKRLRVILDKIKRIAKGG
ncbi:hypothetical protein AGMMS49942_26530 [Spirochaetia bacterium]|nr:hypothetical protein AGMMS49942_26530 [Spirochaetia bacterium]